MLKTYKNTFIVLANVLLKEFDLILTKEGLYFHKYTGEGAYIHFKVSDVEEDVFNILKLDYKVYLRGFKTMNELFLFIIRSPFFSSDLYNNIPKTVKAKNLKNNFILFQQYLILHHINIFYNFKSNKTYYYKYINSNVINCNVLTRIKLYNKLISKKKVSKKKFNGHIILKYCKEYKPGKLLADAMERYKKEIAERTKEPFYYYTAKMPLDKLMIEFKAITLNPLPF